MNITQILIVVLSGLGVFHGFFIAILLWSYKGPALLSNRLLSLLMIILSLRIGKSVVMEFTEGLNTLYIYAGLCLLLFIGPLFLLYCKSVIFKEQSIARSSLIHFLPGLFFLLLTVPFQLTGFQNLPEAIAILLFVIFYVHLLAYLLVARRQYIRKGINNTSKEISNWLNILFFGLLSIWSVYVLNLFEDQIPYILAPVVYSATVYLITYLAISRNYIRAVNSIKYQTTSISEAEIITIYAEMEKAMQEQQLWLNPKFSLDLLSRHLKAHTQKISLVINTRAGCNFNEYVNRYRVRHAITLMDNPKTALHTIASISFDSGFNSLSSFNHAFKKLTGKTPSAYRNAQMMENS